MTKVECVETICAHNVNGYCTKEAILLDVEGGWLTCIDVTYEEADNDTEEKD